MLISNEKIEEVKNRLVDTYDPLAIYLFGSYAWGKPDEDSDLDILVIVDKFKKRRVQTIADGYLALFGTGIHKDLLVYSKDDFEKNADDVASICYKIKRKGKIIYAKA